MQQHNEIGTERLREAGFSSDLVKIHNLSWRVTRNRNFVLRSWGFLSARVLYGNTWKYYLYLAPLGLIGVKDVLRLVGL